MGGNKESRVVEGLAIQGMQLLNNKVVSSNKRPTDKRELAYTTYSNAITRQRISLIKLHTPPENEEGQIVKTTGHRIATITPVHFTFTTTISIPYHQFYNDKSKRINATLIKNKLLSICAEESNRKNHFSLEEHFHYPNLILTFLKSADVSFTFNEKDLGYFDNETKERMGGSYGDMHLSIDVNTLSIPIFLEEEHTNIHAYLDYKKISYRIYKDIATKGWSTRLYSQYLYIEDSGESRGGGYFIGVKHSKPTFDASEALKAGFTSSGHFRLADGSERETFIKFFADGMTLNYKKESMNKLRQLRQEITLKKSI